MVAESFGVVIKALDERFEPNSRWAHYQAEFHAQHKKHLEGWAQYIENLSELADKAFPMLQDEAED